MDEVKEGAVLEAGTVSQEESQTKVEKEPLTEAKVAQMLVEAREADKKHFQSLADTVIAKANREARDARTKAGAAEASRVAMKQQLLKTNPQAKQALDFADAQARLQYYDSKEAEDTFSNQFYGNLKEDIVNRGIDPTDKRIDWGEDAKDTFETQKRVLASVAKIQKDDEVSDRRKFEQRMEDKFAQLSKDAGIDSVRTDISGGAGYGTGGLKEVLGMAKNTREAKQRLDEFIKGA